jgi:metacaspase-1
MAEPTLRWGSSGPAVQRLQEALTARGHYRGAIDGRFGAQTHNAVLSFQRASGLTMDGVVGPRTWSALVGAPTPTDGNGTAPAHGRGISIHIGVNRINPAHYGTSGVLHGCENDARAMETLARSGGFEPRTLMTESATSDAVLAALGRAAGELRSGDTLFLTYAGHGAQVEDKESDEDDRLDETWCLYDRMLLDDELYAAWGAFAPGVRIILLSDSCHSGTISRTLGRDMAVLKEIYYDSLVPPTVTRALEVRGIEALLAQSPLPRSMATQNGEWRGEPSPDGTIATRNLPQAVVEYVLGRHGERYRELLSQLPRASVQATVIALSGCQDNQLSQESGGRGKFSVTLERIWNGGAFSGSYGALHRAIVAEMPPTQTPNYTVVGAANPQFEAGPLFTTAGDRAVAPVAAV